ncbi:THUMP domain-containing class I SAM-dependent RNA methyltransferase [Ligilactobacillus salivarius]|uniref:THUMP domain-containing class I SAM-dependent RNA methyltransferase n=1 Tax=Ligilactobacillus salivarius TaxID=1624 RepID=UPI0020238565|nr:class I SAM-dependent RNA methyltransferase [Ligilactobacillus salivarius]URI13553.1 class I SAM-dependent RNA methyltransferase [Ligilactobacillus salivarius]UUB35395.1 class I SAM-dependent RNA methyltransferase [Ligilactobacillus salivarius]
MNFKLIATCAAGIESIVGNELKHLGYKVNVENGRVRFDGDVADIAKTNLWLRTADRIKIVVGEFTAKTFEELFQGVESLNWEDFLPLDAEFPVAGKSQKSTLHNVPSVQAITKKAIVTKMSTVYHRRTKLPETGVLYPIEVAINKDKVLITLDTTGSSLFKRGYRVNKGGAPLKENMAAALVLLARWYPEMPFVDPVCGSGTIPIEAALIGCNIAPGLKRNFAFENWDWVDKDIVKQAREQAQAAIKKDVDLDISGYDIDGSMIEIAKENAVQAGVQDIVNFKQMAVKDFKTDKINGVIVANPPYGERLSDKEHVHQLYQQMSKLYQPLTSWSKYILTSDLQFEQFYGTKATKRRKLYNGSLRTDFFQYWGKKIRN